MSRSLDLALSPGCGAILRRPPAGFEPATRGPYEGSALSSELRGRVWGRSAVLSRERRPLPLCSGVLLSHRGVLLLELGGGNRLGCAFAPGERTPVRFHCRRGSGGYQHPGRGIAAGCMENVRGRGALKASEISCC